MINNTTVITRMTDEHNKLDTTVNKILNKERTYLEDQLLKEKRENNAKEGIIQNLKKDIESLAI